jgi:hypothetical protein
MVVPTIVLQSPTIEGPTAKITWSIQGKSKGWCDVGSILTGGNSTLHLQLQGANDEIQHQVSFIKGSLGDNINTLRLVCTGRHSMMNTIQNQESFAKAITTDMKKNAAQRIKVATSTDEYVYSNVIEHLKSGKQEPLLLKSDPPITLQ